MAASQLMRKEAPETCERRSRAAHRHRMLQHVGRHGIEVCKLADDELGGYRLPRGWLAFVIPYVLHRLPAFWQNADTFDPDRFSARRIAALPKFVYLPFGAGPRQCIGNQFALIEAHLVVGTLAQRYRFHLVPGHRVEPWPLITLRPRFGMPMIIERRTNH
jgi:cytochrome P450